MIIAKNSLAALNTAVAYAQLDNYDIYALTVICDNGLYELSFSTDVMDYRFFVEVENLEVLGFDASPVDDWAAAAADILCA